MINKQTSWRSYVWAISSIGINLTLVYTLIIPAAGNRQVADFKFPPQIPIQKGQAIAVTSNLIPPPTDTEQKEIIKTRQQYQYIHQGREINLGISYLVGTRGDVGTYLQNYTSLDQEIINQKSVKQLQGIGYHALFTENNRAYLTSCISPRSPSNLTQRQFSNHRYQNDLQWQVVLDWLKGNASIRDRRCLWVLLSTKISPGEELAAHQTLETVWQEIYQWWIINFPDLDEDLQADS